MTCGRPCGLSCLSHWSHHHPCLKKIGEETKLKNKNNTSIFFFCHYLSVQYKTKINNSRSQKLRIHHSFSVVHDFSSLTKLCCGTFRKTSSCISTLGVRYHHHRHRHLHLQPPWGHILQLWVCCLHLHSPPHLEKTLFSSSFHHSIFEKHKCMQVFTDCETAVALSFTTILFRHRLGTDIPQTSKFFL